MDQYLLCRAPDGFLTNVAHILGNGIELQGRVVSLEKFQELLGPETCVTFIDGRLANSTSISAAISAAAAAATHSAAHQQPLLNDDNDEFCLICSLGGDLICCETCPATFHTECIGLSEIPVDDWFCPACTCSHLDSLAPTKKKTKKSSLPLAPPPELIPCSNYTSHRLPKEEDNQAKEGEEQIVNERQQQQEDDVRHGGAVNGGAVSGVDTTTTPGDKRPSRNKTWLYQKLHLEDAGQLPSVYTIKHQQQQKLETLQLNNTAANGIDDIVVNGGGDQLKPTPMVVETLAGKEAKDSKHDAHRINEAQRQRTLAEVCALGEIPLAQVNAATKPIQMSFQLIHTAAATAPPASSPSTGSILDSPTNAASPRGRPKTKNLGGNKNLGSLPNLVMPGYSETQKSELRQILSAALHLVRTVYAPVLDSRTGRDILPWLFRGKTFTKTDFTDYSAMHVAVLFVGSTIAGVACVRSLGNGIAEIPIFTVREELRGNRLGEHFLSQIEKVLEKAGIELITTPAMILPGWPFTPSSFTRPNSADTTTITTADSQQHPQPQEQPQNQQNQNQQNQKQNQNQKQIDHSIPLPMQSSWGYSLATREDMQRIAKVRPLVFPGIYTCVKNLTRSTINTTTETEVAAAVETRNSILVPRSLPISLALSPEIHVDSLRRMGFIELRGDKGTGSIVSMHAAPGYNLIIKSAAAGAGGITNRQGPAMHRPPLPPQQQQVDGGDKLDPAFFPPKRKYTKRKQQQDKDNGDYVAAPEDGGGGGRGKKRGRPKRVNSIEQQQPQVLQARALHPEHLFNPDYLPTLPTAGAFGHGTTTPGSTAPAVQPLPPQQQYNYPLGAPVLHSLVRQHDAIPPTNRPDLASIQQVQAAQAQQLEQVEDAIRREQANLLQGLNRYREQQDMAIMIQQQQQLQHELMHQQYGFTNDGYIGHHNVAPMVGGGCGSGPIGGFYQQNAHQFQLQQQFEQPLHIQSIYENHQRIQQQQRQLQNTIDATMQPPPPQPQGAAPGHLYHPSSQQQQQQQFNPVCMPAVPPISYNYYGNGNGNGL